MSTIHILLGLSLHHLQAYPSGLWMLLPKAKPISQGHSPLSNNLWQENLEVPTSALHLITRTIIPLQAGMPPIGHTSEGWEIRNSLLFLPLVSVGFEKVQQSLSPGTLVLVNEHIGLMATQVTELYKNRIQIA